ncbi:retinoblastoma-related protein isoform X5 [Gossypium hirsutum]|uniref:Retinoblastoma-related protein isoform X5 n=1 Tax=Gossypium hirsutum TaxID=3635 RepID=A0ABM3BMC5_GOSHI|nr:retinoblastoma-related protein isoform X5 [Gossypium hirsutum]
MDGDAFEARFTDLCKKGLSSDEKTCLGAMKLFKETKHLVSSNVSSAERTVEEAERFWFSFVLYSLNRLSEKDGDSAQQKSDENRFTLCQILRATKLKSYKRAFWELFLSSDANIGKQESATSAPDYLSKYHRFGWLLFLALRVHAFSRFADLVTCANGFVSVLAILILHVPICYRNFKINDSPRFVKKGEKGVDLLASLCNMYDASEAELRRTLKMTNKLMEDILKKKPCPAFECKTETLEHIDTDGLVYFEGLLEEQSFLSNLSILENNYNNATRNRGDLDERLFINEEDSLLVFGSLSGEDVNISGIKRKFDSIASPSKTITSPLSPHCHRASHVNGVLGPLNGKVASTPVSTAMTTAKWLRTFICPLPSRPSAELQHFLSSCDKDVTNDVIRRAHIILEAIFPCSHDCSLTGSLRSANLMDDTWMEQRRLETLKLYYRVLEAMCTAEAQILRAPNLTPLLTNERFHRCMLACSAELVLATHKTATMLFPTVLGRTGITAFDLSKVIESFIRHEKSLPRELKRHLNSLEERLLESMVWDKGSSLYNTLIVARPALSSEINRLGLLAEPMPSLDAIAMHINFSGGIPTVPSLQKHETSPSNFGSLILGQNGDVRSPKRQCTDYRSVLVERNSFTSPAKDRLLAFSDLRKAPLQSVFASPTRPNPVGGGETCAETGINIFFSKINKLAAVWINGMVERLQLSQEIRESVYFLFQQILSQRTSLFFNHHIDQIILCCLYVVAKLSQLELPFKEITRNYRKQLQGRPEVYCSVFVDRSSTQQNGRTRQDHVGIVAFYNTKFIPAIKYLLEELDLSRTTTRTTQVPESNNSNDGPCPGSPKVASFPSLPDMSPMKVSAKHNVYVSPLRASKMDALISHSARSYYACVGESTRAFQSPSKDLTAINNQLNSTRNIRIKLKFDDLEGGLVSDSMVANSLYLQSWSHTLASSPGAALKSEQPES